MTQKIRKCTNKTKERTERRSTVIYTQSKIKYNVDNDDGGS